MIKLVVFDWNGTLLADLAAVVEATNVVLSRYDVAPISVRQYQETHEIPLKHMHKKFGIDEKRYENNMLESNRAFHDFYEPRVAKARTRSGTRQTMEKLHSLGMERIILSNHTIEGVYLQLERLKLAHHFETILANDDIVTSHYTGKEHRLKDYLELHKISPAQTVIVGDTTEEIRIGHHLGLKTVAITGGYNTPQRLKAAGPDAIINKLYDLITVVKEL